MDIVPYILQLLSRHQQVGVSGLGTFYLQNRSSYFDQDQNRWYPPSQKAGFSEEVENEDLLPELISAEKNISGQSAAYFIEKFVTNIKVLLASSHDAILEGIGRLSYRDEQLSFEPDANIRAGNRFYGLAPVAALPLVNPVIAAAPAEAAPDIAGLEEERKRGAGRYIWIVLILLLAGLALAYTFYPQVFDRFLKPQEPKAPVQQNSAPAAPATETDSLARADSIVNELEKQGFEVEKPRDTLHVNTEAATVDPEFTYEIIVASFATQKEANEYIGAMKKKGIAATVLKKASGKWLKISAGSFNNQASAEEELPRIQKEINKEAWIERARRPKTP